MLRIRRWRHSIARKRSRDADAHRHRRNAGERHALRAGLGVAGEEDLRAQFLAFANFGNHGEPAADMDGARFAKYCADCHVTGRGGDTFGRRALSSTDVDLAFARVKAKGARRIDFGAFVRALGALAERQGAGVAELAAHCLRFVAPTTNATSVAEDVRLHDDKVRRPVARSLARAPSERGSGCAACTSVSA